MGKIRDLVGERFGRLIVLERAENRGGTTAWLCRCDCGVEKAIRGKGLTSGKTRSCGCLQKERVSKDLTNKRFGRLVVIEKAGRNKWNSRTWFCKCDCGGEKVALGHSLTSGGTKSCGCLLKETISNIRQETIIHGMSGTRVYQTFSNMIQRCYNKNNKYYKNYGGRGIKICDRWLASFANFYEDMGDKPEGASIDRINPDGDYEPSNCRWASTVTQARNKEGGLIYKYKGVTLPLKVWLIEIKTKGELIPQEI